MGYAFISYSSKNQLVADALRNLLNSKGIDTWMAPGDIPVGSSYMKEINHALKNCACLVLLLSNAAQESQWVIKEVERAVNYHKSIIPVQIESVILNDEFEFVLGSYQVVAVHKIDHESDETKRVLNSVRAATDENKDNLSTETLINKKENYKEFQDIQIGTIIDEKYQVICKIGEGGFCKVYLAENKKTKKKWAIKVIKLSQNNYGQFSKRLSNEISLVNKLQHPYLPSIADIIQTSDNLLVVMDYIEGVTLDQIIDKKGAQSEELVIDWAKKLCDALGYLHSCSPQIIHNDICPRNIILKPNGDISIIDFGTAIEYLPKKESDTVLLGTPVYAAPEKFRGIVDTRSDIYSLGMVLYALVTGENPTQSPYAVYPLRRVNPNLSCGLEFIVNKFIEKDPIDRYQSASEIIEDLENIDKITKKLKWKKETKRLFSKREKTKE